MNLRFGNRLAPSSHLYPGTVLLQLLIPIRQAENFYFQTMCRIPSLMELQAMPSFKTSNIRCYTFVVCHKSFERERYLKDHIQSVHVKSVKCDFCNYHVAPRRRQRLHQHMLRKHNFPVRPSEPSHIQPASD